MGVYVDMPVRRRFVGLDGRRLELDIYYSYTWTTRVSSSTLSLYVARICKWRRNCRHAEVSTADVTPTGRRNNCWLQQIYGS